MYYLNNSHHDEPFSLGQRHMAHVDIMGVKSILKTFPLMPIARTNNIYKKVYDYALKNRKGFRKFFDMKPTNIKLGNTTFSFGLMENQPAMHIANDGEKPYSYYRDYEFFKYICMYYNFDGFGELTNDLENAACDFFEAISLACLNDFFQVVEDSKSLGKNPEVSIRQITYAYWAAETFLYLLSKPEKIENYKWERRGNFSEPEYKFQEIANKHHGTDIDVVTKYYGKYFNKKMSDGNFKIASAIVDAIKR